MVYAPMSQSTLAEYESTGYDCPDCDRSFDTQNGLNVHHGKMHDGALNHIEAECAECGAELKRPPRRVESYDMQFCDPSCQGKYREGQTPSNKLERETRECEYCGDTFTVRESSPKRYCNKKCSNADTPLNGKANPNWKPPAELECEICGSDYTVVQSQAERSRFCSEKCLHEYMSSVTGPDHWLWQGGVNFYRAIRSCLGPTGWHSQRAEYLEDECEVCGAELSPPGRDLTLHHIVPVLAGGTNGEYNYMTLCEPCHSKAESFLGEYPGFDRLLSR